MTAEFIAWSLIQFVANKGQLNEWLDLEKENGTDEETLLDSIDKLERGYEL